MTQPTRVLMLLENNPFPQDSRVRQEAAALIEAGYRVTVICPRSPGQRWRDTVNSVRVYRYPPPPEANGFLGYLIEYGYSLIAAFVLSLVALFRGGFDVIHAHNPPDVLVLVALLYKPFGKRFVFDQHDLSPEMYFARFGGEGSKTVHRALLFFEKLSYRFANHVIATNESYKRVQMERGNVPQNQITIVRNGPDLKRLVLAEPYPDLRQKANTIIGYVGVMGFQDGIDYLLRALHHLVYDLKRTDFYCVIMGDGDALPTLKTLATELNINEYVWFTGYLTGDAFVRTLSTTDICVDPDPSNTYNDRSTMIKLMEYMALQKPIVAFDLPEHRFSAQDAAVYAKANDEMDFARQIAALMDDPDRRQAMGRRGRERIETALAWHYQAEKLVSAYRTLSQR
jgi:glycosyltransferase involved in cell wall biosynthesis